MSNSPVFPMLAVKRHLESNEMHGQKVTLSMDNTHIIDVQRTLEQQEEEVQRTDQMPPARPPKPSELLPKDNNHSLNGVPDDLNGHVSPKHASVISAMSDQVNSEQQSLLLPTMMPTAGFHSTVSTLNTTLRYDLCLMKRFVWVRSSITTRKVRFLLLYQLSNCGRSGMNRAVSCHEIVLGTIPFMSDANNGSTEVIRSLGLFATPSFLLKELSRFIWKSSSLSNHKCWRLAIGCWLLFCFHVECRYSYCLVKKCRHYGQFLHSPNRTWSE